MHFLLTSLANSRKYNLKNFQALQQELKQTDEKFKTDLIFFKSIES